MNRTALGFAIVALVLVGCGGGEDDDACQRMEEIKSEIVQRAKRDGISGDICVNGGATNAVYADACKQYYEAKAACEG